MSASILFALLLQSVPPGGSHHAGFYPYQGQTPIAYENELNFFDLYDINRNDVVDRRELQAVAVKADRTFARRAPEQRGQLLAAMTDAFATLDRNGDGRVTRTEFQQANVTS
ncbi:MULTISPECIES: EF-hand domain-containing protein [unclassified Sphingomonas]|uniref:EF-hand domain-containing protein n=1 Tax=unclassified Sphingomonas TaxID=196159 RepID=UPI000A8791BB|nr:MULTISPECIES: EF-hand domain-containing protein [unclassified Sphingomonas]